MEDMRCNFQIFVNCAGVGRWWWTNMPA